MIAKKSVPNPSPKEKPEVEGRRRVVIEDVKPAIDSGRFPIKRTVGEAVVVEADVFVDSHDAISCSLLYRKDSDEHWTEVAMVPLVNDRWQASFTVAQMGRYRYTIQGWVDRFESWRQDLAKKAEAGLDLDVDFLVGATLLEETSSRAEAEDADTLQQWLAVLRSHEGRTAKLEIALDHTTAAVVRAYPDKEFATLYDRELLVVVDRVRARFSAWYEMFPRSSAPEPGRHGTFKDCETRLAQIAEMGFDVLYFPPIHPIGRTYRKGKNNRPQAGPGDPGSPWAIGAREGGHKSVHPELGTLEDFQRLVAKAQEHGMEIAMDLAYQCSADHPYMKAHPEWFRRRPDGTIQYAENPPKKYEDIYPFDFDTPHWRPLWEELKSVVLFWMDQGIRIFRVDNPHTKPFAFWEWLIQEVKSHDPEVIFLAEAFTRPKVMYRLAKIGFTQSYTYFAWRNTAWEISGYLTELTRTDVREFFRPNFWPNTPDILTEYLQMGGRPAFMARLVLAATLAASYGIYGPAFELCEDRAKDFGSEEYLASEKYEIKDWNLAGPHRLNAFIARVNQIRYENPALQSDHSLSFHETDNDQLLCFSKQTQDRSNIVLVVVNLDPHHTHGGWLRLPFTEMGLAPQQPYQVHDLLSGARYLWHGARNYVEVDPQVCPAHIFRIRRRIRTERDFDYFM